MAGRLLIGTSGWHYASWLGPFYPERHPKPKMLAFYAGVFRATEINLSFYRQPTAVAVAAWREGTPEGFVFAWKAHRVITHYRRLRNTDENLAEMFGRIGGLGPKAGPVLFQLPPQFRLDRERLAAFLAMLPAGWRYTFEFRHPSWYEPAVLDLLRDRGVSLCILRSRACASPVGLHGRLRLRPRPRAERPLLGQLRGRGALRLGAARDRLEAGREGRVLLLRQRHQGRRPGGCCPLCRAHAAGAVTASPARWVARARSSRWIISARPA